MPVEKSQKPGEKEGYQQETNHVPDRPIVNRLSNNWERLEIRVSPPIIVD
jgi:hypothetical protein